MRGLRDEHFFAKLAAKGVHFRLVDDPMVRARVVEPLIVVGAAGLYAGRPVDDATLAEVAAHEAALRIFVGGHGLAELQRSRRISEADARTLAVFVTEPETLDFLLASERDPSTDRRYEWRRR